MNFMMSCMRNHPSSASSGVFAFCIRCETWTLPSPIVSTMIPNSLKIARCSRLLKSKELMSRRGGVSLLEGSLQWSGMNHWNGSEIQMPLVGEDLHNKITCYNRASSYLNPIGHAHCSDMWNTPFEYVESKIFYRVLPKGCQNHSGGDKINFG